MNGIDIAQVRMDLRGHGRSSSSTTTNEDISRLYAADFQAVLNAFNLDKPVLVGWGLGGM